MSGSGTEVAGATPSSTVTSFALTGQWEEIGAKHGKRLVNALRSEQVLPSNMSICPHM